MRRPQHGRDEHRAEHRFHGVGENRGLLPSPGAIFTGPEAQDVRDADLVGHRLGVLERPSGALSRRSESITVHSRLANLRALAHKALAGCKVKVTRRAGSQGDDLPAALDRATADVVANAMKDWAIEKGATHYAHVFYPLTGLTAEKHDSFLEPEANGGAIAEVEDDVVRNTEAALQAFDGTRTRRLVGITTDGKRVPRQGYVLMDGDVEVGAVCSGAVSPTLDTNIATAYVPAALAEEGQALEIGIRNKRQPCTVCALPFYSRTRKKSSNDADRLRKYLGRFGLTWSEAKGQSSDRFGGPSA